MDFPFLRHTLKKYQWESEEFQSLFLWIFRSYVQLLTQSDKMVRFQSLFLWIFRSYTTMDFGDADTGTGFNPCSYGFSVLTLLKKNL